MRISPGYDRDPLRPNKHHVLVENEEKPGEWFVLGQASEEPLAMLALSVRGNHAIGLQQTNMMIVDESGTAVESFNSYRPLPQPEGSISPENQKIRDRWISNVIRWLLGEAVWDAPDTPEGHQTVNDALKEAKINMAVSPDGCGAIVFRDGNTLAVWSV